MTFLSILKAKVRARGNSLIGTGAAAKAFVICQPKKVSIPPIKDEISRLHYLSSEYLNG